MKRLVLTRVECDTCGNQLTASCGLGPGAHPTVEVDLILGVEPCETCLREARKESTEAVNGNPQGG